MVGEEADVVAVDAPEETFWEALLEVVTDGGEAEDDIAAVVIGHYGWGSDEEEETLAKVPDAMKGVMLTAGQAKPLLSYEYDSSFGAPKCHAVYLWTSTRVIFVSQYDGSTSIEAVPRLPNDCWPKMPGQ